jgi:hypothetical protein
LATFAIGAADEILVDAAKRGIADDFFGNDGVCWGFDAFGLCGIL